MNLRSVDLNLLVVLEALLEEAHVSRAAERLGLSQPAASNALERCRQLFHDPLLMRGPGGMHLTPRAEGLRGPLRTLLAQVTAVLDPPPVPLAALRQRVRLAMAELPAGTVLGPLHAGLARSAPGIDLVLHPWRGGTEALEGLAKGGLDLAVSVLPQVPAGIRRETLLQEHYRVLLRRDHPATAGFDLDRWLAFPHVLVSGRGETEGALDQTLARLGRRRRVALVVPSFLLVPPLLLHSELIALLPSRCLPPTTASEYLSFAPPVPVEGFPLHLAWHARSDADPGVQHVAGLLRGLLRPDGSPLALCPGAARG